MLRMGLLGHFQDLQGAEETHMSKGVMGGEEWAPVQWQHLRGLAEGPVWHRQGAAVQNGGEGGEGFT